MTSATEPRREASDSAGVPAQGAAPRVSIVVPAYNRERYVDKTLDSVLAQTVRDWEVVVFDDGSRDGTAAAAQRYADADARIRVFSGENRGVAWARNRGFGETDPRSEFVIFLDSDDVWEPDALETLLAELETHPEYASVHGLARCIDGQGQLWPGDDLEVRMRDRAAYRGQQLVAMQPGEPVDFGALVYHNYVITPGIHLIRRAALEMVGEFDPDTDPADDWDFAIRLSRVGTIGFVERLVLNWRRHDDTLTQSSPRWKEAYYLVRRKMLTDPGNTPEQTQLARLGYLWVARGTLRDARTLLFDVEIAGSARQCARALDRYVRYLRVTLAMRFRRATGNVGGRLGTLRS